MAYINGNKPIITNGLVYALDFANSKTFNPASTTVPSLVYNSGVGTASNLFSYYNYSVNFNTYDNSISGSKIIPAIDKYKSFTISWTADIRSTDLGVVASQNNNNVFLYIAQNSTTTIVGFYDSGSGNTFSAKGYSYSSLNQPTNYTWAYSSGSSTLYINTVPVTSSFTTQSVNSIEQTGLLSTFNINGQLNRASYFREVFTGSLSDVTVYNRALSWDEIKYNYNRIKSTKFNSLPSPTQSLLDPDVYSYTGYANITDTPTINALNTFVVNLKQQQLWDKITNIYPFINSVSSSLFNLKDAGLPKLRTSNSWSFNSSSGVIPSSSNSSIIVPRQPAILSHANDYPFYTSQSSHITYLTYDQYISDSTLLGTQNTTNTYIQASGGNIS